jgi:16S rRNA (cytosine967-C5)-methyltransferase
MNGNRSGGGGGGYRKGNAGADNRRGDNKRKDYHKKDAYRKEDAGGGAHRKSPYDKDRYRKDDTRKTDYRKEDAGGDAHRKSPYGKDRYRKDDTRKTDYRKEDAGRDGRRKEHAGGKNYRRDDTRRRGEPQVSVRQIILKILSEFDSSPGDPERIADRILSRRRIEHRDRRFVFEIVYGVLRNRIYLDYVIDRFISGEREPMPEALRRILEMGVYQILFLDRVPDHAAVNESVDLAKLDPNTARASGFINAVLRNVIKGKFAIALPDSQADLCGRLSVEFSHPRWMVERWLARYGLGDTKKILEFNNERPAIYLRRRMRDISRRQFEFDMRTLCEAGCGYLGLYYKMKKPLEPESLRILRDGFCSVQSPSCGWVVAMLGLRDGERALDVCSAPGGKATLMAELVGESGVVVAADLGRWKMKLLAEAVEAQGLRNVRPVVCDGLLPPFAGPFDKVLLDAPCTGSGVLQRHPDGRFVRTAADVENMASLQAELLDSAAKSVGAGGVLVYSTCSLEPEENERQVERFLAGHPEFRLEPPPEVVPAVYVDDSDCLRITPYKHRMDGMFGARFRKG